MASKAELAEKKDDYSNLLANAITSIREFQNIGAVSLYFHFLIQCNESNLSKQQSNDLIERNYPLIRNLGNNFNSNYRHLQSCLRKIRESASDKMVKNISNHLKTKINQLSKDLEEKVLKEIIIGQYHDDVFYISAKHDSLVARQVKENVWEDFNLSLLKRHHLFEEYRGLLLNLVAWLEQLQRNFQANKWVSTPKKVTPKYERNPLNLKNIIADNKWSEFISHCDYYCEERVIGGKSIELITKDATSVEKYRWNIKASGRPVFAAFVKRLYERKYFSSNDFLYAELFKPFLYFFTGQEYSTKDANDIAKYFTGVRSNKFFDQFDRIR